MKPTTINHPFRTISLDYMSDAPLSELEQTAIEKYVALHDKSQQLKETIQRLHNYYTSALEVQQQCRHDFDKLQNEYVLVAPMLHYFEEGSYLPPTEVEGVDENERVCYDTQPLMMQLEIFKYSYNDYIEPLKIAEKEHADMVQFQEKVEEDFDEFDEKYFSPIVKNYEQMEIDIAALDEDFDNFRGAYGDLMKLEDDLCDARNVFIAIHIPLHEQILQLDKDLTNLFTVLNKIDEGNQGYSSN
jgi:hypothetical protein